MYEDLAEVTKQNGRLLIRKKYKQILFEEIDNTLTSVPAPAPSGAKGPEIKRG